MVNPLFGEPVNPMLPLVLVVPSQSCSAMCRSIGSRLSSAVPDLVLNLDVEQALLPLKTVV